MSVIRQRGSLWLGAQVLFLGMAFWFLGRMTAGRWPQIAALAQKCRSAPLVASLALGLLATVGWAAVWRCLVVKAGARVGLRQGVYVYLVSNLAKYIPGSVWVYASRAYLGEGVNGIHVGISTVWEIGITAVGSLVLTTAVATAYPAPLPHGALQVLAAAALLCLVLLLPPVFRRAARLLRFIGRRPGVDGASEFRWRDLGLYLVAAIGSHILVGSAFFLFIRSFVAVDGRFWLVVAGLWSFAATVGLFVLIAPYGLGVKEGLLVLLLQVFMPLEAATLIALASRLWTIAVDLLGFAFAMLFLRTRGRLSQDNP